MARLYDPTASTRPSATPLAARVADLNDKVIGMLDISKPKGNVFLDRLTERIQERYRPRAIIRRVKPTFTRPAPENIRKELEQQCDVVIEALAD